MRRAKRPARWKKAALIFAFGAICGPAQADSLTNPAAVLCKTDGAEVVIETLPNGSERGVCVFPNGERINEWAYFRNKHRSKN